MPTLDQQSAEPDDLWRCTDCSDEMPAKYRRTHPLLCQVAAVLEAHTVDKLLVDVLGESP